MDMIADTTDLLRKGTESLETTTQIRVEVGLPFSVDERKSVFRSFVLNTMCM